MDRGGVAQLVAGELARITGAPASSFLSGGAGFGAAGIDSLDAVEAVVALEADFGIDLGNEENVAKAMTRFDTLVDCVELAMNSLAKAAA